MVKQLLIQLQAYGRMLFLPGRALENKYTLQEKTKVIQSIHFFINFSAFLPYGNNMNQTHKLLYYAGTSNRELR